MQSVARVVQFVGLVIPPLAIVGELNGAISLGQMLGFLAAAICLFSIGYLLQQYSGDGS